VTSFDYIVLAVIGVSGLLGLIRGLIKEVLSLTAYLLAFMAAIWWGPRTSGWIQVWIENGLLRTALAYGAVFFVVLLLIGLLNMLLATLIEQTGLTPADHGLGGLFGLARGVLLVLILVILAGHTELPKEPWWEQAKLADPAIRAVQSIKAMLPPSLAEWLPY